MQVIYESQRIAERSRKRILNLAKNDKLSTDDPLLAEIALAQVDATLAVAQAMMEVRDEIAESRGEGMSPEARVRREKLNENLRFQLRMMEDKIGELTRRFAKLETNLPMFTHQFANADTKEERQEVSRLWWEFWKS